MRHGVVCIDESHDGEEIKNHVATDCWNGSKPERGTLRLKQKPSKDGNVCSPTARNRATATREPSPGVGVIFLLAVTRMPAGTSELSSCATESCHETSAMLATGVAGRRCYTTLALMIVSTPSEL